MRVSIIGPGNVGGTLGRRWIEAGYAVTLGVRNPEDPKYQPFQALGAEVKSPPEAAAAHDVVVLATPWDATRTVLDTLGPLDQKILVDCTNALKPDLSGLTVGFDDSGGEQVARWAPGARVVKAFSTVGFKVMADPILEGRKSMMLICGDDEAAKALVTRMSNDLGFETIDAGPLHAARMLEPLALLWISLAFGSGLGPDFAFSVIRRTTG